MPRTATRWQPGNVYILPEALGVIAQGNELKFQQDGDLFASLPADDSAVIVLSGSDPAAADAAMGLSWGGALVAGQMPEGCYDATAAEAVIARGAHQWRPGRTCQTTGPTLAGLRIESMNTAVTTTFEAS